MPGQLNLTGASAAIQLVGNDTITTDQEFVFPDTGGTVVTDDFTGDVEIDGSITASGDTQLGGNPSNGANPGLSLRASGEIVMSRAASKDAITLYENGSADKTFVVQSNGSITADGSVTLGPGWGNDQSVLIDDGQILVRQDNASQAFGVYYGGSAESNNSFSITGDGKLKAGTDNYFEWRPAFGACQLYTTSSNADQSLLYGQSKVGGSTIDAFKITCGGAATFKGNVTAPNTFFALEPDNDANYTTTTNADGETESVYNGPVLDVKESIRNMQAALYRLKAAVLIPDTTVDQLRLRILEALETITEEVD